MGNRLTQGDNGTLTNYTYDNANRLTNVNAQVYTWDNNGNLLNDGTSAYTYDQANRIKTLTQGTNNYAFAYNGVSDRISQTVNSVLTRYTLDLNAGLTQVLADGSNTYLYGIGRIAQQQTSMQYFGADGLGSVRQLYNSSGQIIFNKRYDPFGSTISQSGVGTSNYGFTGEWTDVSGLEYLRARYYAPVQGRFVTKDLYPSTTNQPMSYNAWLYVYANPANITDPYGLDPNCINRFPLTGIELFRSRALGICARERLDEIIDKAWPNGAEALLGTFNDEELLSNWGDVSGRTSGKRLEWLLDVTRGSYDPEGNPIDDPVARAFHIPIQFGIHFGLDCGFAEEFRDSQFYNRWRRQQRKGVYSIQRNGKTYTGNEWVSNQVGHFLTAVALAYDSKWEVVDLGLKGTIGHEQIPDDADAAILRAFSMPRIPEDLDRWNAAVTADALGMRGIRDLILWPLLRFNLPEYEFNRNYNVKFGDIDEARVGNSLQDLRLSLKGYRFAKWVKTNSTAPPGQAGDWLKENLGIQPLGLR